MERPLSVEELEAWRDSGAGWRILEQEGPRVIVEMCACTGEPVERRIAEGPAAVEVLRADLREVDD